MREERVMKELKGNTHAYLHKATLYQFSEGRWGYKHGVYFQEVWSSTKSSCNVQRATRWGKILPTVKGLPAWRSKADCQGEGTRLINSHQLINRLRQKLCGMPEITLWLGSG